MLQIVTNSGHASTLAATDAATPPLRRIGRAAIAAATPITYHSRFECWTLWNNYPMFNWPYCLLFTAYWNIRELLLLIREHLQATGLAGTAAVLLKEAQLSPLLTLAAPESLSQQTFAQESSLTQIQWPSGHSPHGFLSEKSKIPSSAEDSGLRCNSSAPPSKKKSLIFSTSFSKTRNQLQILDSQPPTKKINGSNMKQTSTPLSIHETPSEPSTKPALDTDS